MESETAGILWSRSEDCRKLKHKIFIGDGDSKGFAEVTRLKPYGELEVVKEECVGHIQKRMGK